MSSPYGRGGENTGANRGRLVHPTSGYGSRDVTEEGGGGRSYASERKEGGFTGKAPLGAGRNLGEMFAKPDTTGTLGAEGEAEPRAMVTGGYDPRSAARPAEEPAYQPTGVQETRRERRRGTLGAATRLT